MNTITTVNEALYESAKILHDNGFVYQYYSDDEYNGRELTVNGKKLKHFANCSYMGLETHPVMKQAAIDAVKKYGTQNSMSRAMVSSPLYKKIEENLAQMFPGYQIIYPTTTLSHCSTIPNLIGPKDAIILDAYVHNSVRMASQLCKANGTFIIMSKHNDMEHVKYLHYRLKKEGYEKVWYLADGVYSIHGNFCDTLKLNELLNSEDDFFAYIDDAHGLGWHGDNGKGVVLESIGMHEKMVVSGSLSKSIGANGGIVIVNDPSLGEKLKFTGQTMIFSGPLQPAILGALLASTELHLSPEILTYQKEISDRILFFRKLAKELELPIVTKNDSPIQLLRVGDTEQSYYVLGELIKAGFFSMTASYPAIEKGDEGIRITVTRYLTFEDIESFLQCISTILKKILI